VEEDSRNGHVLAPIPRRPLVEQCALGRENKFKNAMCNLVQVSSAI